MTQTPELKVCFFCGGEDAFIERADFSSCYVVCNDCGAHGPTSCNENEDDCLAEDSGMEPGENAARRLWNTRPLEADNAALKAKNEALVEALGKRGFMMTETDRSKNYPRARRLIIGFENGDDADDLMAMLSRVTRQALAGAQ